MDEVVLSILESLLASVASNDRYNRTNDKPCIKSTGLENQTEDSEFNFDGNIFLTSKDYQFSTETKESTSKTFNVSNSIRLYESQDLCERKGESESESEDEGKSNEYKSLSELNSTNEGKKSHFMTSTPNRTLIYDVNVQFKSPDEISNIEFKESLEDISVSSYETVLDSFIETPTDYENTDLLNLAIKELIDKPEINRKQDAAIQTILTENIYFPAYRCKFCRLKYFERESLKPLCLEYPVLRK